MSTVEKTLKQDVLKTALVFSSKVREALARFPDAGGVGFATFVLLGVVSDDHHQVRCSVSPVKQPPDKATAHTHSDLGDRHPPVAQRPMKYEDHETDLKIRAQWENPPMKRFSVDLPLPLHTRFKTACSATNRKMASELKALIEQRTVELERQTGLDRLQR
ncbi:hypothetical protein [Lamprobacter modestohalophilus]|nr:hypothetical protein [Lamprobacter modestohalophilus]